MNFASAIAASTICARCFGAFRIAVRRQPRRRFDEARQHRGLRDRDVLRRLAEIALRRGFDAIGAGAEIDAVEIELEDLVLGMLALQPERELHLLQLALQGALLGQEQVLGELLRQRRAALRDAAMQDVGDGGAHDADRVDAEMRIEAAVLDGDEGLRQIGRQVLQRDIGAGHFAALWPARCRRGRRSRSSAGASGFPATGSAADVRRPRPRRQRRRSRAHRPSTAPQ